VSEAKEELEESEESEELAASVELAAWPAREQPIRS
jgi:hypothetical protein